MGEFQFAEPSRRKVPVIFLRTVKANPANPATFRQRPQADKHA